ncbi:3' terminal RNA ribose 2'-O-methyltransferase Hen1 [Kitasatospora sp. RB6PN24]|uniref:3' terminal RNA ribose 2'-O-methyltransferase Hen1 n=1 Tax=Kitasatospora humi TaxID=2893891 RepID=UPI001E3FDD26|nr:3' terminal RNA ribose 2'-O-methyltransferase Hen1 [Kitasatospora humi]MCC9310675.1 3' terminal RNA ribose 2'-O-methyltransferase Hen1 [Kitasatospora humi]
MFISITTTGTDAQPATDLGYMLHKHPEKVQQFSTAYGEATVFYPEVGNQRCTAALLLEVDPIGLVRRSRGRAPTSRAGSTGAAALAQYVNDRTYAASSLLAVALRTVFRSAMKGVCVQRPGLAEQPRPLTVLLPAVAAQGEPSRADEPSLVERLFAPLGWQVEAVPIPLDESFPEWGTSRYLRLELTGTLRLADALQHLYVLLPVLDGAKHYWVAPDEVDKLLAAGAGWLAEHPERALIVRRYLQRRWSLANEALRRLELVRLAEAEEREPEELDDAMPPQGDATDETGTGADTDADTGTAAHADGADTAGDAGDATAGERPLPLAGQRRAAILDLLRADGAARVLDLGCGQGELIGELLKVRQFTEILGVDVSAGALAVAARRLRLHRLPERQAARVRLLQGALTYTNARLRGYDAAVLCEVIEHLDEDRLPALEYAVFGAAHPATVLVTMPNAEYNVLWESLPAGRLRHGDHRFEWDRAAFRAWAERVAAQYGYRVSFQPVGPDDPEVGPPSQLAAFRQAELTAATQPGTTHTTHPAAQPGTTHTTHPADSPSRAAEGSDR